MARQRLGDHPDLPEEVRVECLGIDPINLGRFWILPSHCVAQGLQVSHCGTSFVVREGSFSLIIGRGSFTVG